jgi:hypothetical protein
MAASIVLVHGGFVDGSGWEGVYNILKKNAGRHAEPARGDNGPMKRSSPHRSPPSAAARARVKALRRGEAPIVRDPEEARGVTFISPAERQAAFALAARKRAAEEKKHGKK